MSTYGGIFDVPKLQKRIEELNKGVDSTNEANLEELKTQLVNKLTLVDNLEKIKTCNIYIITVPTPITKFKTPDLCFNCNSLIKKGKIFHISSSIIGRKVVIRFHLL